jgi:hypothetical protein
VRIFNRIDEYLKTHDIFGRLKVPTELESSIELDEFLKTHDIHGNLLRPEPLPLDPYFENHDLDGREIEVESEPLPIEEYTRPVISRRIKKPTLRQRAAVFVILSSLLLMAFTSTLIDLSTQVKGQLPVASLPDTILAKYWGGAPILDASKIGTGADMCAKIASVYSDATYVAASRAIIDATGFTGDQNCASNMLAITKPTWIKLGQVILHTTVNQAAGFPTSSVLAAPAAPTTASTTTTGGTLSNQVFVKVGYMTAWIADQVNTLGPSPELTASMNAACSGTPTCTATINSPAAVVGAYSYNVFQSNTTGNEKLCNVAPIPIGTNYKITANCGGVAINTANLQFTDTSIISGVGDDTKISLENAAASIDGSGTWNWIFQDMSIVSTLTTQSVNGMLQLANKQEASNITFTGGGNHIYMTGKMVTVKKTRHYGFTQTTGPVAGITGFVNQWLRIEDTTFSNFTFPVSATLNNGISLSQCDMCTVDGMRSENIDNSQAVNGGSMMVATGDGTTAGASSNITFTNFQCENLININCADALNMTHDIGMSNGICRNTNNVAGTGANILGADCFDIFMAARFTLNNLIGNHRGGAGGNCCPSLEVYSSVDGSISNSNFSDDLGNEGVRVVGSPSVAFNNVTTSRNLNSGIVLADSSSVVTCNGTTTVAWVSGQPFGPFPVGMPVNIGAGPTQFNVASVTDFHTLVLSTTCGLGASQAFSIYTQDTTISAPKADDNGQAGTGTGVRTGLAEGIYCSGHCQMTVIGGSLNDNAPVAANKHQQYGIRMENSARARIIGADTTSNAGGSNCLLEIGANVATNHGICDSPQKSYYLIDDNTGEIGYSSTNHILTANSASLTSTQTTIVSWNIAASFKQSFSCEIYYQGSTTSAVLRLDVTVPASPTFTQYSAEIYGNSGAVAPTFTQTTTGGTNLTGPALTAGTTTYKAKVVGTVNNGTTAGVIAVQAGTAAAAVTIQKGSFCMVGGS